MAASTMAEIASRETAGTYVWNARIAARSGGEATVDLSVGPIVKGA